jgi:integrase
MSTYLHKATGFYVYDFRLRGRRFFGSTGCSAKREADAFERRRRAEAKEELDRAALLRAAPMTLDIACDRYWLEVGQHHPRPDQTEWSLAYIIEYLGKDTLVSEITDEMVATLVARRRGEFVVNKAAETVSKHKRRRRPRKEPKRVSPSTVNRSVTEPLRKVLNRARDVWAQDVRKIKWRTHLLKETQERIRSMSIDEERRLFVALNERYHDIVFTALRMGLRASELVNLEWNAIDWGARTMLVLGKGNKLAPVPIPPDVRDRLWRLQNRHPSRVFSWRPEPTEETPDRAWRPMAYSGLDTAFGRAVEKAQITDFRFHDTRHTFATRFLRKTGNLKATSKLLRHSDVVTTSRYAHVLDEDLRDLVDEFAATASPVETHVDGEVTTKKTSKIRKV